jgi:cytochrome c
LVLLLYGCQPDTPPKQAESLPANAESPAASQVTATNQSASQADQASRPVAVAESESNSAVASAGVDGRALAQKSGCFTCHRIDKKVIGPAWNDIAAKYRGQKDAEARLIAKVAEGGSGVWGSMPMPPNAPRINDSDIKTLVRFILSLK